MIKNRTPGNINNLIQLKSRQLDDEAHQKVLKNMKSRIDT